MTELHIPHDAFRAMYRAIDRGWDEYSDPAAVDPVIYADARAVAEPVVCEELRRLLHADRPGTLAEAVRDRLAELEQW